MQDSTIFNNFQDTHIFWLDISVEQYVQPVAIK